MIMLVNQHASVVGLGQMCSQELSCVQTGCRSGAIVLQLQIGHLNRSFGAIAVRPIHNAPVTALCHSILLHVCFEIA